MKQSRPRIVVVGPCASGKSTLANRLQALGYDVRISGQEHSSIRNLWQKLEYDLLVALTIDLKTLRDRRSPTWPEALYKVQRKRLHDAYQQADVIVDTAASTPEEVVLHVLDAIEMHMINSAQTVDPEI